MKVFLDANILIAIIRREEKRAMASARVLSLALNPRYRIFTTAHSIGTCFYFAGKKHGDEWAKRQLSVLCEKLFIAPCDEKETKLALKTRSVHDLEEGLQYFAALHSNCDALITYNTEDFYFSNIPVYQPDDFLLHLTKTRTRK